jgi:acetyl/propionyl-CoA carboxylase alpha subunit
MRRALGEYEILGIRTNIPFFRRMLEHPEFVAGQLDTELIDRALAAGLMEDTPASPWEERAAMVAAALHALGHEGGGTASDGGSGTWRKAGREALLDQWPRRGTGRH